METDTSQSKIRFARHVFGMAILAAANPLIYYSDEKIATWASTWIGPLIFAGIFFGLYAVFFRKRAAASWPKSFFMLAWVLLALVVLGPYLDKFDKRAAGGQPQSQAENTEANVGPEIDAGPPTAPTQENAGKSGLATDTLYSARVRALQRAAETGALPTMTIRPQTGANKDLGHWPKADVEAVESTQTWWLADNSVWLHVTNRSIYKMDAIHFEYAPTSCSAMPPGGNASYLIHLEQPLAPRSEVLVHFPAGDFTEGCLTIVDILG